MTLNLIFESFKNFNILLIYHIVVGINDSWELELFTIKFEYLGGSHTGKRIKEHFDTVVKSYDLDEKIYRVITDQGANMKNAFKDFFEACGKQVLDKNVEREVIDLTNDLVAEYDRQQAKAANTESDTADDDDDDDIVSLSNDEEDEDDVLTQAALIDSEEEDEDYIISRRKFS